MPELILYLTPIIILAFLFAWIKTPQGRGFVGEMIVRIAIGKTKEGKKYVINDLMITTEDNKSSQIDHILINKNGVFVIETKNYSGRIYGSENQLEWTQVLNYGKVKNKLYNPIKQNATHIHRVKEIIGTSIPITSIIVFVKGNTQYINAPCVYNVKEMKKALKNESNAISEEQMKEIYQLLFDIKQNKKTSNKEHIKQIEQIKEDIANDICPRCGGALVERNGAKGAFKGCSNFPKCKFTKKI